MSDLPDQIDQKSTAQPDTQPSTQSTTQASAELTSQEKLHMVSSRLARQEQKKIVEQTLVIAAIAILVLLAFLFFILPQVVRFAATVLDRNPIAEPGDTIPPQPPVLSAPVSATNSALLPISGVGEAKAEAVLVLNGSELERLDINDEGDFSFDVPLSEGENVLLVYSVDEAGNESIKTKEYKVMLDTEAPTITIEEPTDGTTIELRKNQNVLIKGTTESNAQVYINDRLVYARSDGSFNTTHQLQEGENKLSIRAVDQAGNQTEQSLTVTFKL